ncbi:hypothetical protein HK098_006273 [Nowakowskiella sp. JEL0407]|nr:hypothetical protein HK098_006273 [Nowakowskiella sp. JEL0407]
MASCSVLFFASARDATGTDSTSISFNNPASLADIACMLVVEYPSLKKVLASAMLAVNDEYVDRDMWFPAYSAMLESKSGPADIKVGEKRFEVKDGNEIAVIPPVSGG